MEALEAWETWEALEVLEALEALDVECLDDDDEDLLCLEVVDDEDVAGSSVMTIEEAMGRIVDADDTTVLGSDGHGDGDGDGDGDDAMATTPSPFSLRVDFEVCRLTLDARLLAGAFEPAADFVSDAASLDLLPRDWNVLTVSAAVKTEGAR